MKLCIYIGLYVFLLVSVSVVGEDTEEPTLKKKLYAISSFNDDLKVLDADGLFAKARWILSELRKWKTANPDPPEPELAEPSAEPDPFGFGSFGSLPERPLSEYDFTSALRDIFGILLLKESKKLIPELQEFARQYAKERAGDYNSLNDIILDYLILANVLKMAGEADPPIINEKAGEIPDYLQNSDPDLISAWRKGESVKEAVAFRDEKPSLNYHEHFPMFMAILEDALVEDNWERADQIGTFEWGSFCGHGSGELYWRQFHFMALNRRQQGQTKEAYAILMYQLMNVREGPMVLISMDSTKWTKMIVDKLSQNGFDWESSGCGIVLFSPWYISGPRVLGEFGGNKSALLAAKASLLTGNPKQHFRPHLEILNPILCRNYRDCTIDGDPFGGGKPGKVVPFLKPGTEKLVVDAIIQLALHEEDNRAQCSAIQLLGEHAWPAAKSSLLKLASHPVPSVSKAAFDAFERNGKLAELGEVSPSTIENYQFNFRIKGEHLSNLPVSVQHCLISRYGKGHTGFGGTDVKVLNLDGGFNFNRPDQSHASDQRGLLCLSPSHPAEYMKRMEATPDSPFFWYIENYAEIKQRKSPIIDIPVVDELRIDLEFPGANDQSVFVAFQLEPLTHEDERETVALGKNYMIKASDFPVILTKAGHGRYSFSAWGDGLSIAESKAPVVVPETSNIKLTLKKGYQLQYQFDSSNTGDSWLGLSKLAGDQWETVEEVAYQYQRRNWSHLSEGKYRLTVYHASQEDGTIEFEINPSSPAIIDLGNLERDETPR